MPIPQNYSAPVKLSAKDRAYNQIQEWIVDGTLVPNEKINDAQLANALGISRTPVREALQLLALQGLAAQTAADMADEKDIKELQSYNKVFEKAIKNKDYFAALKQDEHFHGKIVKICDNAYLESSINVLQAHVRRLFFKNEIILSEESVLEHKQIIEAIKNKDAKKAGDIAKSNWERSVDNYC